MNSPHPALGIDPGDARIGVAATDPEGILPHPVETIDLRRVDPIERIAALAREREIRTLIVGLPLRFDGSEGSAAEKVRGFGKRLATRLPELPLHYVDEFQTTVDAARKLHDAGRNAKRQKAVIDQAAAVEILNRWMDQSA